MADNVNIDPGTTPTVPVATDEIGGVQYQRVKLRAADDGSAGSDVSTANPLPVVQTGTLGLPTGAATSANQTSEVAALGAPADVAYVSGSGSLVALLKGLFGKLPALVSGRVPVDGSGVTQPVSGTVTANAGTGTLAVSGPLTDTQLRATAVPVSGTVTASGPLTDTQLRASAVPVSGPLTDTQLRATPVPVSGTVTATPTGTQAVSHAAATQADGHSANIGLLADASSANTLTGLLKAIKAAITGTLPVSGPLTDTQLRATAVPVSGTVTANAGTGTLAVSLASVPSHAVTNAGTFATQAAATEVRATTGAAPSAFTATSSTQVFASNAARKLFTVYNNSDKDLYLMLAAAVVSATSYHVKVAAGGFFSTSDYSGEIRGIMSAAIGAGQVNPGEYT